MSNSYFRFKQFTVNQSRAAMKVGTDGVLLGAWCCLDGSENFILDVGCGSGLIALMAAQRTEHASVLGIDIDRESCLQASENVAASPWADRIKITEVSLQDYVAGEHPLFDHVISNPPFFRSALMSPNSARRNARHAVSLPYATLASSAVRLLKPDGAVSIILPYDDAHAFISEAASCGLFISRRTDVAPLPDMKMKRVLLEFRRNAADVSWNTLVIGG